MKKLRVEFTTNVKISRLIEVTDEAAAELNKLSEETIINGKKYIDMLVKEDKSEDINTAKGYEIISSAPFTDNILKGNDGVFNEVFFLEVEP